MASYHHQTVTGTSRNGGRVEMGGGGSYHPVAETGVVKRDYASPGDMVVYNVTSLVTISHDLRSPLSRVANSSHRVNIFY